MRFYILIFTLFSLLLIGKGLETNYSIKPNTTQLNDCRPNTIKVQPLCGSIGSIKIKSIETDKLNFSMWCPLIEDKPRGWGLKK